MRACTHLPTELDPRGWVRSQNQAQRSLFHFWKKLADLYVTYMYIDNVHTSIPVHTLYVCIQQHLAYKHM